MGQRGRRSHGMRVFLVDAHSIYRCGLVACLDGIEGIESVTEAATIGEALTRPELNEADVVLVDHDVDGLHEFISDARERTDAAVLVSSSRSDPAELKAAMHAGAVGYLWKETLTPEALVESLRTAATGSSVLAPEPHEPAFSPLTEREQEVLRLVADGHPTREVARRLSYSERTVKNVIHDVVRKFNARSRSQAVAAAVREGLI